MTNWQTKRSDSAGTETLALKRVVFWDPEEPTATRPLAINVLGDNLYFPTVDLTKNVCELVDFYGDVTATYDYAPFGAVTAGTPAGTAVPANPFQWSSEVYDSELDLVYYNYRHYSPADGRFLSRDPIEEQGGLNLYAYGNNDAVALFDFRGLKILGDLSPQGVFSMPAEYSDAGGFTKLEDPIFRMSIETGSVESYSKNGKCCFKYKKFPDIDIKIVSRYMLKIKNYSKSGIEAIRGHESRRISTYVYAYDFYIASGIVNFLTGQELCCDKYGQAVQGLSDFASKVRLENINLFEKYVKEENDGIESENLEKNRVVEGGMVVGLKNIYSVKPPSVRASINFCPSCF